MNPLLLRQLQQHAPQWAENPAAASGLLAAISATYDELQQSHQRLERVMSVTSDELAAANDRIRREADSRIADLNHRFQQTLELQQGMIVCACKQPGGFELTLCRGDLARRLGFHPGEVEGRLLTDVVAEANRAELTAAYERAWAGEHLAFTYKNAATGLDIFAHLRPRLVDGEVREIIGSYVEITALHQAEATLRDREGLLSSINDNLESTIIYRAEHLPSGEIRCNYVSPGTLAFVGVAAEEFLRHPGRVFALIHPDDLPAFRAELARVLRTGEVSDIIVRLQRASDGALRWMHFRSRLSERRPDGIQVRDGIVSDVTALKETEARLHHLNVHLEERVQARSGELAASERLLSEIIETTSDGIMVIDHDGRLLRINRRFAEMWGTAVKPEEIQARPSRHDFIASRLHDPEGFRTRLREILASDAAAFDEVHLKDGRVFERYSTPLRDHVQGRVVSFRDVTERKRSETRLSESEEKFRGVFDHSPVIIALLTVPDGRIVELNPAASAAFGLSREEAIGQTSSALGVWADQADRARYLKLLSEEGAVKGLEARMLRRDGTPFTALYSGTLVTIGGQPYSLNLLQDITGLKNAEAALRESEERFREVFDQSPIIIGLLTVPDGRVVELNAAGLAAFGYTREEVAGKTSLELNLWADPEVRDGHLRELRTVGRASGFEVRMRRKNGEIFIGLYTGCIVTIGGRPYSLNSLQDVTARKESELARDHLLAITRATLESTADGILVVDQRGKIVTYNRLFAQMWRLPDALLASSDDQLILHHALAQVLKPDQYLARVNDLYAQPLEESFDTIHLVDGRTFERYSRPQFVADQPAGRVWSFRDVTARLRAERERQKLEESLRQSQKFESLGTLAGGIAHDFNNILTGIFGFIELTRHDLPPDHPTQEWLNQTLITGQRAKELVRQILTFSRRTEGERHPTQLAPIVAEALRLLRSTLPSNVELASSFARSCPMVMADATQIHQVVLNLCTNAWHALPPRGGRIAVTVESCQPSAELIAANPALGPGLCTRLSIADNGSGMDPATLSRIFEPFFTTKETGQGTGLGLAVVHGIVGSHRGAIDVQSAPGKGTTFELYFPGIEAEPPIAHQPLAEEPPRGQGQSILWVDDDEASNLAVERMLRSLGYRVTTCLHAEEGLAQFHVAPMAFDLLVTDLSMPGMNGGELTEKVLALRPGLPVLMISGFVDPRQQASLLRSGVTAILHKPVTRAELAQAVTRLLM
jgi:PAS domain S-box-containing protein